MSVSTSTRAGAALASILLLSHCAMDTPEGVVCRSGDAQCGSNQGTGGATGGAGGSTATGGTPATGGALSTGGMSATGGTTSGGAPATGGAVATGGSSGAGATSGGALSTGGATTGGVTSSGGAPMGGADATGGLPAGGATSAGGAPSGGATSDAGMGGSVASGGAGAGGTNSGAGTSSMAGSNATGGMAGAAGGGMVVDQGGVPLAKPGDSKNGSRQYLNLGDMRLIANKWGSDELGCNTSLRVFVETNKTFGWEFDRGACGGNKEKPDYPEIEFGIHPFGAGNALATTPSFSSTALLPIQIKSIMSASVVIDSLNISIQRSSTYNLNFEFWLSQRNPLVDTANPGVHAELITFFAWQDSWACDKSGNVQAGDKSFSLCHQDDAWAGGKWRYYQFRASSSNGSFTGRIDVKALIEWLVTNAGYSRDLWVTRLEVGSEIDDNTAGKVTMKNITFEVNGTSKAAEFGQ